MEKKFWEWLYINNFLFNNFEIYLFIDFCLLLNGCFYYFNIKYKYYYLDNIGFRMNFDNNVKGKFFV